ncbi:MAG: hypothetical protein AABW99_03315 [archaeon]
MDYKATALIAATLIIFSAAYYSVVSEPKSMVLAVSVQGKEHYSSQPIEVSVSATGTQLRQLTLELGTEKKTFECGNKNECSASATFSPGAGVYQLIAAATNSTGKNAEQKQRLVVSQIKESCVNGIPFSGCAPEKPLYCNNGILENNCGQCGCSGGYYCSAGICAAEAAALSLKEIIYPEKVQSGKKFSVKVVAQAASDSAQGAKYVLELKLGKNDVSAEFSMGQLDAGEETTMEIPGITLEDGTYDLNASVFSLNAEKAQVISFYRENAVSALTDADPPQAPQITGIFVEGMDAVISWSNVGEASTYNVYKSFDANPAFISYRLEKTFDGTSTSGVIQGLGKGAHFFVVTAVDAFGNESRYSNVESVSVGAP